VIRRVLTIFLGLGLLAGAWLFHGLNDRPDLALYASLEMPPATPEPGAARVMFLGVSTLLVSDGESSILIDGFFSRPGLLATAFRKIGPDRAVISRALSRAGIDKLDAIITCHSHYDHAMDAPQVARRTGATLYGSISTAWLARGQDLPEGQIRVVRGGEHLRFGNFEVDLVRSAHVDHGQAMGSLDEALIPPAHALEYLEGGSFSILIGHAGRRMLVQSSAGFVEGALAGESADVVFLGVGLLGRSEPEYQFAYWQETVDAVGASRVIPIHWDDFTRPLHEPLVALPRLLDDFPASMRFIKDRALADGVDVRMPPAWVSIDPFSGL
jgi:L-ascorbate metabolism protein UlaG (beta-lactamase superfamily)